jgi:hypothetical protein
MQARRETGSASQEARFVVHKNPTKIEKSTKPITPSLTGSSSGKIGSMKRGGFR